LRSLDRLLGRSKPPLENNVRNPVFSPSEPALYTGRTCLQGSQRKQAPTGNVQVDRELFENF
jgi:hypothetical protein